MASNRKSTQHGDLISTWIPALPAPTAQCVCPRAAVWVTLALIAVSAICGAVTDLSFNMAGYLWQIVNCAFTAGYSLSLRGAMDKVTSLNS